ncbi:hypothetical protein ABH935_003274 [Catenulispora sp. GAS73]|uniref:hypothetical protein n=1 Tax=Catenulispora sp. GAS73 TaxID=3156269 RepID=UPI00351934EF
MTSRVCRALSALVLFVGAANLLPGSADAEAARSDSLPVEVGINQVSPQIPNFTDTSKPITFAGQIRNTGTSTLRGVHLEVWRSLVTTRSNLGSANGEGYNVQTKAVKKFTELAAGAPQSWKLAPTELELFGSYSPQPGVYAIDIDAFDQNGVFLGGQRTYMVWKPMDMSGAKQTRIALMWPVVGQPGLTGQKKADPSATPILSDQSVAQQFAQGSRLSKILNEGASLPLVNWLVDPDLLYTANTLSGGYFYPDTSPANADESSPSGSSGNGASSRLVGAPGTDPKDWYNRATTVLTSQQGKNCWNLLYGDPDLNTLSRSDPGKNMLKAIGAVNPPVGPCRVNGQTGQTIAWPSDGQADATTLAGIAAAGGSNTVALVGSTQVSGWPSAHAVLPGSPNTIVYDSYLSGSGVFADPAKPAPATLNNAGVLEGQVWLAQTALADRDNTGRVLVVTPPRDFDPPQELLQAIKSMSAGTVPTADQWFGLDDLGKALNTPATPEHVSALSPVTTANLSSDIVASSSDSQQLYQALYAIMPDHQSDPAVALRPAATWWRNHPGDATYSQTVYSTAVADHALVSIVGQTAPLTMSGKSGTVPVAIRNQTTATIKVYLRAHTSHTVQLKVDEDQGVHPVERGQSATIRIPVKGEGNGVQVDLYATLYTCADMSQNCTYYPASLIKPTNEDGGHTKVTVKVSRIGIIALSLIIGSGVLLVLLIGLRVYRAKRTHHASAQDTMAS